MIRAIFDVLTWMLFVVGLFATVMIGFAMWAHIHHDGYPYQNVIWFTLFGR